MTDAGGAAPSQPHLRLEVFTSPTRAIPGTEMTFSPITSTIVYGETSAVLVDAQFDVDDIEALGDLIASTGRTLQTIFVTHGHGDHWFGAERLAARFGAVDIVATQGVVDYVGRHLEQEVATWSAMFGDRIALPTAAPTALVGAAIDLEGHRLPVVPVTRGDVGPAAVLHVPSLRAVIAGDVAYNGIHQMLAFGGPKQWQDWSDSVAVLEALAPEIVVAGHKRPGASDEDIDEILGGTRRYLRDFAAAVDKAATADDVVDSMTAAYPDRGNVTTLIVSARAAVAARERIADAG